MHTNRSVLPHTNSLTAPLRMYIVEPQMLLARAIASIFSVRDEFAVVGETNTFDPERLAEAKPDMLVIDVDREPAVLQNIVARSRQVVPDVRVCVLSSHLSAEMMLRALAAGADGYVIKDISPEDLIASIRAIRTEGFYADPRLSAVLLRRHAKRAVYDISQISPRELDVVRLIAQGLSNREISQRLLLSDKTVKNHISNILSKLQLSARTQVAIYAIRNGLV